MDSLPLVAPDRHGRWNWPLADMEVGDAFLVDKDDRGTERVRNYVSIAAGRLKMRFSVTGDDPEHPGFTRVTCVDPDGIVGEQSPYVDYSTLAAKVKEYYGRALDASGLPWSFAAWAVGGRRFVSWPRVTEPKRVDWVLWMHDNVAIDGSSESYHVRMEEDGLYVTRLANNTTYQQLLKIKELMS